MSVTLIQHIVSTSGVRGGKPRIDGTRITVSDVVIMHLRIGQSPAEIAGEYALPLAGVYAALAYYYDNKQAIDQEIEADESFALAFHRQNPSRLQAKLNELRG